MEFISFEDALKWLDSHEIAAESKLIAKIYKDANHIYPPSLYYHGLRTKEVLTKNEASLYTGRSLNTLNSNFYNRKRLESEQKKLLGNFGENFTKFILMQHVDVNILNTNKLVKNKRGYDLLFSFDNADYGVSVTARERFEHRTKTSKNKPENDGLNFYTKRQHNAIDECAKDKIQHLYFSFLFYYHESEIIKVYILRYTDIINVSTQHQKSNQKIDTRLLDNNRDLTKEHKLNLFVESTNPVKNEVFEEMLYADIDSFDPFYKYWSLFSVQ